MDVTQLAMIRVLFLSAWYPHRYDSMLGLFVKKHAEAVSRYCEVTVLYVYGDSKITEIEYLRNKNNEHFNELIIYFPSRKGLFGRILNFANYLLLTLRGIRIIFKENGKPDIVHANILNRSAFPALMLKYFKKIPYVVTEHWSRYLPTGGTAFSGFLRKAIVRCIVRNASTVMPVSVVLKEAMLQQKLYNDDYEIVHNVVDDFFFDFASIKKDKNEKKNILHISCFDEQAKNVGGILRATKKLSTIRQDFRLILIGTGKDFEKMFSYANQLEFPHDTLIFTGEKSPEEVVEFFRESDFMILFSNFETAGIVIAESLICGKPVISTKVGSATELIDESTGMLIEVGDESQLLDAMNRMLDTTDKYDGNVIKSKVAGFFDYKNIGNQIHRIYQKSIQSKK
jgi:glycosyltransferase involved in cell wall biosynthesis